MLKKIGKIFINIIIAFFLIFVFYYFCLIKLPEHQVQGSAAPAMTKEETLDLMDYHGVKVVYVKDGEWVFDRKGKVCSLKKKK